MNKTTPQSPHFAAGGMSATDPMSPAAGELFRAALASIGDGVICTDTEGRVTFMNAVAEQLTGWNGIDAAGQPIDACFHIINEDTRATVAPPVAKALRLGRIVGLANHTKLIARDGRELFIDDSAAPIRDANGTLIGVVLVFRDVSERRAAELTSLRLAAIVENSDDAIIAKNLDGIVEAWNEGAERIFGYTAKEMIGQSITKLIPPERLEEEATILRRLQRGERIDHFQTIRVTKDGRPLAVSVTISPVKDSTGRVVGASKILRDITLQKKSEEMQQLITTIVETSDDAIYSALLDGTVLTWNEGAERMFGYTRAEAVGHPISAIFPSDIDNADIGARLLRGERLSHYETRRRRKDGREIQVWLAMSPIKDATGNVVAASAVARDITRQKQAERDLREAQQQLERHAVDLESKVRERTARLEESVAELEAFSYSLSHDMRAPLRAIQSFTEIVLTEFGEKIGEEGVSHLRRVVKAAARMDRLIQDVLAFSRVARRDITVEPVDVEKLVRDVIYERPALQPPRAEITIESPLLPMCGHVASLTQCISNLLDNAVKFVTRGVTPRVRIYSEPRGGDVRLWIEDNGIGIEPQARGRLFDMFQRLHTGQEYDGTGVGLAIVRKATERMNGRVGLESEPGKGSRFWIQLPAVSR